MRALVLSEVGGQPVTGDFDEPGAAEGQQVVTMRLAGLNPVDRIFSGMDSFPVPRAVGTEGVGTTADGIRVYFDRTVAPFGSVAERAVVPASNMIKLPESLADDQAVIIGIAGLAGWLPLSHAAQLQAGESVLVLGATGVQGQIAVQAAKLLGAGRVVAAGRDRAVLESLKQHGADDIAVLDGDLVAELKRAAGEKSAYDVIVDSLYGEPHQALLDSGTLGAASRVIVLGASAGTAATVTFRQLQSAKGATIAGYSNTDVPRDLVEQAYLRMASHSTAGELVVDTKSFGLEAASDAWTNQAAGPHHKVLVRLAA